MGKTAKFSDAATQTLTGLRRGTLNQRNFISNIINVFYSFFYSLLICLIFSGYILKIGSAVWHMWGPKNDVFGPKTGFFGVLGGSKTDLIDS